MRGYCAIACGAVAGEGVVAVARVVVAVRVLGKVGGVLLGGVVGFAV